VDTINQAQERAMRTLVVVTAFVALLALGGVSEAAQISSPAIFGVATQEFAECVVLNGGNTPLNVTVKIINFYGVTARTYSCGGALGAGQFCSISAPTNLGYAPWACVATAGSVTNLRGALTIHEELPDGWGSYYLRSVRSAPLR
jgi:hypothetical protein